MTRSRGSVLVLALWALSLLTFFALSLGFGVRQKAALLNRLSTLDALYPIAYSGVEKAKSLVAEDRNTDVDMMADPWGKAAPQSVEVLGGRFSLGTEAFPGLVDEERKINLNAANADMVMRLLQAAGQDRDKAEETAYCLLDWMDSDSFFGHPKYGAEDSYYDDLPAPYEAKDAPYESMDELLLVKGMTQPLLERIRAFITVYGNKLVNMNTASGEVLAAMGFSAEGVATIQKYRAGADQVEGTRDDNYFTNVTAVASDLDTRGKTPLTNDQLAVLNGLIAASKIGVASSVFSFKVQAVLKTNGATLDLDAVIDRGGHTLYCRTSEPRV